jgi:hypothetical protein
MAVVPILVLIVTVVDTLIKPSPRKLVLSTELNHLAFFTQALAGFTLQSFYTEKEAPLSTHRIAG